jgi:hypothetical protein
LDDPVLVDATVVELDEVVVLGAEVLVLGAGVVVAGAGVVAVVGAAVVVPDAGAVPLVVVTAPERSITPTAGDTSEAVLAGAVVEALDPPSEAQAARPNVTTADNTAPRTRQRAAKAGFFIDHYPGCQKQSPGQRSRVRTALRPPAAIRMTTPIVGLPVTPLSRARYGSRPEALRPHLAAGLPLRSEVSRPD